MFSFSFCRLILKDADVTYIENNMNSSVFPDLKASGVCQTRRESVADDGKWEQ